MELLRTDGRMSFNDLAATVHLSPPPSEAGSGACRRRVCCGSARRSPTRPRAAA
ncbi:hypothetical protein [Nesterenkonia sp. NBAIMH1]|uniref:hypothetical protein n=1 Tax=Nesterenkonia sp. NBAIMH1 TaxID=2600320 RepID=UPI00352C616F